ncbi:MAG: ATP synthase subunit I [bacterium]|nr:ATP synthase subunit I [bacterium]
MIKVILLQCAVVLAASVMMMPWLGSNGAVSALLGAFRISCPTIFVLRLQIASASGQASAATFFVGELFKVVATVALLAVAQAYFEVHWLALLIGLFATLKANLFAFLLKT